MRLILAISLLLGLAAPALAQPAARAAAVMEQWNSQQLRTQAALESLRFVEDVEREIDSPFMTRIVRLRHEVTVRDGEASTRLVRGSVDGESIDDEAADRIQRRLRKAMGPHAAIAHAVAASPARVLPRLRPVGEPQRDALDGRRVWRFELESHQGHATIDRATVWFADDLARPRILRSRLVLRLAEAESVLTITTDYDAVDGPAGALALAREQLIEGVTQQRRRWRTFTVIMRSEGRIEEVRPTWRRRPGSR